MERNILTVANVNSYIKQLMDKDYILKGVWVQGEVSNYKAHSSGHLYFTLKDENSAISCVMFRSYAGSMDFSIKNGMKIIVAGSVSVYERSGQYQIYVKKILENGLGKLYQAYEKLKKKLEHEGLFDATLKKPIPRYAKRIGIVTSDTGAAIRDMVQVAKRRNPYIQLVLYPSLVQGPGAAENVTEGIRYFNRHGNVDTIIIGRGGGSIEDLWAFNEEIVARAVFESNIPVISAVGHETDFTIADFVADLRAPTPSAAAELAVYDYDAYMELMDSVSYTLKRNMIRVIDNKKKELALLKVQLEHMHPLKKYERKYQLIAEYQDKLQLYIQRIIAGKRHQAEVLAEQLRGLSPLYRLKDGYGYVSDKSLNKIKSIEQLNVGSEFRLTLSDGFVNAKVTEQHKGKVGD